MAEQFVEDIYKYSKILTKLKCGIKEARRARSFNTMDVYNSLFKDLCNVCGEILETDFAYSTELTKSVMQMSDMRDDMMLLSDHVERNVIPVLIQWIKYYADIEVEVNDDIEIKSSDAGYLTLKDKKVNKFIHSTVDPMDEAEAYVEHCYDAEATEYIIWGCGMGYYAYQLYLISDGSVKITIYENKPLLVEMAFKYGVLGWIPKENVEVIIDEEASMFLLACEQKKRAIFHLCEIETIENESIKEALMGKYVMFNTITIFRNIVDINVHRNIQANLPDFCECDIAVQKEIVIVAAGPSLDDNLENLRQWKGKKTIVAVNTVFKKLLENGIRPDFVVALDSSINMNKHLQGVKGSNVPVILDIGVYWRWCYEYEGPKYMVYSTMPNKIAENYIKINKKERWLSGGTVTFLALEFAIRNNAKSIYLVGADFAYPNGKSHANGTAFVHTIDAVDHFKVLAVDGSMVLTDRIMNKYRLSLEKRIMQVNSSVSVYNMSRIGAKINGTIESIL